MQVRIHIGVKSTEDYARPIHLKPAIWLVASLPRPRRGPDNGVVYPTGYVNQAQLGDVVAQAAQHLGPEVVHVAYSLGPDSTGEPSLFFRILLDDRFIREDTIADLTGRITGALFDATRPIENWGLRPYFNFRSKSEQDRRRDPDWE